MATRLLQRGHQVVAYDLNEKNVQALEAEGAAGTHTRKEVAAKLSAPRVVWVMVPSGQPTEQTIIDLADLLSPGDIVIDGGNSNYRDTMRRGAMLQEHELHFVDVGASGGIWGLA